MRLTTDNSIILHTDHLGEMLSHVSSEDPLEACGLVAGVKNSSHQIIETENILQSQVKYQIAPSAQLKIFQQLEEQELDLIAIYHSHPRGPSTPSLIDINEWNYPNSFSLIWSKRLAKWSCKAFIMFERKFEQVEIKTN